MYAIVKYTRNQLTVMCTTRGERYWPKGMCGKQIVNFLQNGDIAMLFNSYERFHLMAKDGRTDRPTDERTRTAIIVHTFGSYNTFRL